VVCKKGKTYLQRFYHKLIKDFSCEMTSLNPEKIIICHVCIIPCLVNLLIFNLKYLHGARGGAVG
jgi:hypothetical protein